jgi:glycosyltransferase involved in cell wall biosynthesis
MTSSIRRMKISVVTVSLNAARTIGHTLESFFAQDYPHKELIVIDGASKDGTLKIVKSFPCDGVRVISEPDGGLYHAANKGLSLFTGDAVGFLNADDCFASVGALSRIAGALANADVTFGNLDFVKDHGSRQVVRRWRGTPHSQGAFRRGWMPAHPTFYVRRAVVEKVGRFETDFSIGADYDFILRAIEIAGFRTHFLEYVLVHMAASGVSNSSLARRIRHNYEALKSRRRWLGAGAVDIAAVAKPLRKISQFALPFRPGSPVPPKAERKELPTFTRAGDT